MSSFRSNIFESVTAKVIRNLMHLFFLFLIGSIITYSEIIPFQMELWKIIIIYLVLFVIQIHITNNDLTIKDKEIIIHSSLFKGIRRKKIEISEISEIIFKDEWTESFMNNQYGSIIRFIMLDLILIYIIPWEYKWIQIRTKKNQKFKYYFFGMNFDFYDNTEEILFEDMFLELANKNINVKWKSTKDIYFKGLQEKANEVFIEKKNV